ncbi:CH-like domain in sperm protein/CAMSAP CH domain containing protein, putative [Leishmania lindenbergi]|uniref:CH-like domain in sperm protein/CAMSAP CH domain containing protein n=1 Tax=Leishmania lindenbergi TaxID=651832 RepID=A0AAW3AZ47_9TRYP
MASIPFTEEDLHELYTWVDEIPISRPKRNIARDFADGCSVAEILKFFFPKLVDLHNYVPAMSHAKKLDNWNTLNTKVLRKLYFEVPPEEVEDIIAAVPGAIERFLRALRLKVAQIKTRRDEMIMMGEIPGCEKMQCANPSQVQLQSRGDHARDDGGSTAATYRGSKRPSCAAPPPRSVSSQRSASADLQAASRQAQPQRQPAALAVNEEASLAHVVREKDYTIQELRETVVILSEKIVKLEELVRVKDEKLSQYRQKFGRMPA